MLWRVKGGQVIGVRGICWGMLVGIGCGVEWRISPEGLMGRAGKGYRARSERGGLCAGPMAGRALWLGLALSHIHCVGARAPETKVTVCAQTVAARWAGCCWAPVCPSGWVAWLMWAEWACGQWLQGWVVGVWLGWLAGRWDKKK
ncbi:uncharacterized protein MONOS_16909 [Monocercomonoides exilis]|uniref:uncharacterized protein n=1 Tax=Monocercomonoides exilis TaxID=2049356 RepID=UPI003559FFB9|nr:hypothetical protein MONOS_16909 [Monocercomonoides exilis]